MYCRSPAQCCTWGRGWRRPWSAGRERRERGCKSLCAQTPGTRHELAGHERRQEGGRTAFDHLNSRTPLSNMIMAAAVRRAGRLTGIAPDCTGALRVLLLLSSLLSYAGPPCARARLSCKPSPSPWLLELSIDLFTSAAHEHWGPARNADSRTGATRPQLPARINFPAIVRLSAPLRRPAAGRNVCAKQPRARHVVDAGRNLKSTLYIVTVHTRVLTVHIHVLEH